MMLKLQPGACMLIKERHGSGRMRQEIDPLIKSIQLLGRLRLGHLQMVEATTRQTFHCRTRKITHIEVRMKPEAEGHRLAL